MSRVLVPVGTERVLSKRTCRIVQIPQGNCAIYVVPQHPRLAVSAIGNRFGRPVGVRAKCVLRETPVSRAHIP